MLKTALNTIKKLSLRLRKYILNMYKKKPKLFICFIAIFFLFTISSILFFTTRSKPNDDIFFLSSSNNSLLANKNPSFSVNFGKREDPNTQWVRFEAKATSQNPFEKDDSNFFTKVIKAIKPKSNYGIEMSLKGVSLSETENFDLGTKEETVKNVAEIIGTDEVKTSTELVDSGRVIGENSDEPVSKKTVLNKNVAKGVDIEYQILSGLGLKEEIVINDLEEYAGDCMNDFSKCAVPLNEFVFDIKLDEGLELKKGWFTLKGVSTETYYFVDSDGNYVAHFLPSWAIDGGGNKTYDVSLSVEEKGEGNYEAKVIVDASWLFSSDRVYPIRIDPSIVHDDSTDFSTGITSRTNYFTDSGLKITTPNLVGSWNMNESGNGTCPGGGDICDKSGNNFNATISGTATSVSGHKLLGRDFDGVTGTYASLGDLAEFEVQSFTIEAYVKKEGTCGAYNYCTIMSKGGSGFKGFGFAIYGGKLHLRINDLGSSTDQYLTGSTTLSDNTWYYVAASVDGYSKRINLYINGNLEATGTFTETISYDTENVKFGNSNNKNDLSMNGVLDGIRFWNVVKSSDYIREAYLEKGSSLLGKYTSSSSDFGSSTSNMTVSWSGSGVSTGDGETPYSSTGLLAQWNFNESSGTSAVSGGSCGTSCNGTLANMTTSGQDAAMNTGWTANNRRWGGGALMFDGVNDTVSITSSSSVDFDYDDDFSVATWVNIPPFQADTTYTVNEFIFKYNGSETRYPYVFRLINQTYSVTSEIGKLQVIRWDGTNVPIIKSSIAINDSQWHYIVYSKNGSTLSLYIDGVLDGQTIDTTTTTTTNSSPLYFGSRSNTAYYFKGIIDSTSFYSRALSESEILSNYQAGNIGIQYRTSDDNTNWSEWLGGTETELESFDEKYLYSNSTTGLVSYWNMDETTGTTVNDVKGTNNGTATGTKVLDGVYGKAREFSGSGNYITVPNNGDLQFSDVLTIEGWVNPNVADNDGILYKGSLNNAQGEYQVTMLNNVLYCRLNNDSASINSTYALSNNTWTYFVCTYDKNAGSNQLKMYLNGVLNTQASYSASLTTNPLNHLYIGVYLNSTYAFSGSIDELRVYNTAISATDVKSNYLEGLSKINSKVKLAEETILRVGDSGSSNKITTGRSVIDRYTVGYWDMDETLSIGGYIMDSTSNAYHLIPSSGTVLEDGILGKARSFNGTSSSINAPNGNTANIAGDISVELWIKPNGFQAEAIIHKDYQYSIYLDATGKLAWADSSNWSYANFTYYDFGIKSGVWSHIAVTKTGSTVRIYKDGVKVLEKAFGSAITTTTNPLHLGCYGAATCSSAFYKGALDNLRISNVVRTDDEIAEAYRMGRDHYVNYTVPSTDFTSNEILPIDIAGDKVGNYLSVLAGETQYSNYQPDANTVGLWHMDESAGSGAYIKDISGNNNNGTPTGTTSSTGRMGKAKTFNGSSDIISLPASSAFDLQNLSIEAWINPTIVSQNGFIFEKTTNGTVNTQYSAFLNATDTFYFRTYNTSAAGDNLTFTSSNYFVSNRWNHVVCTYDGSYKKVYVNGVLVASKAYSQTLSTNAAGTSTIGGYSSGYFFNGSIDEVRISNIARTPDEVRQAYEVGLRTHNITVDFGADLNSANLISNSSDTSFTINATGYGLLEQGSGVYQGDKIIVKENYDGTEYIAQGTVASVNSTTGAVTVSSWDSGSTFPSSGYTANAYVFKWQTEYIPMKNRTLSSHLDGISLVTLRILDGNEGRNIWIDNIKASTGYLKDSEGESLVFGDTPRYFQYKAIFTTADTNVSPYLSAVQLDYTANSLAPTMDKIMRHGKWFDGGQKQNFWWAGNQ